MPALHALWRPDSTDAADGRLLLWAEADAPNGVPRGHHPAAVDWLLAARPDVRFDAEYDSCAGLRSCRRGGR